MTETIWPPKLKIFTPRTFKEKGLPTLGIYITMANLKCGQKALETEKGQLAGGGKNCRGRKSLQC